jgi:hypothetical protein
MTAFKVTQSILTAFYVFAGQAFSVALLYWLITDTLKLRK